MSRTRKHKYGRKLHHKKRTVSRNKIKRKMKIKSRKIKQGKVWTNWGIALGANLFAILLLFSAQ